jgi:hypothetical protein
MANADEFWPIASIGWGFSFKVINSAFSGNRVEGASGTVIYGHKEQAVAARESMTELGWEVSEIRYCEYRKAAN